MYYYNKRATLYTRGSSSSYIIIISDAMRIYTGKNKNKSLPIPTTILSTRIVHIIIILYNNNI